MNTQNNSFRVGWASTDITPDQPVAILGQFHARVSEGILDPLTATAMAFESERGDDPNGRGVMVSCDLAVIPHSLQCMVREQVAQQLPDLNAQQIMFSATHTHTAPEVRLPDDVRGSLGPDYGIDLEVMDATDYANMISKRLADCVAQAWNARKPAGMGYGLTHATIAYNRRISYYNGETRMYGGLNDPQFSHAEGAADTVINVLYAWDAQRKLTGVVVNIPCPSQTREREYQISADFWADARKEIRTRLGDVFILPQCSAAGDLSPARVSVAPEWKAQQRMWQLMGVDQQRDTGRRIADAVSSVLPIAEKEINFDPQVTHNVTHLDLPARMLGQSDVDEALADAQKFEAEYKTLLAELEAKPQMKNEPRWYVPVTRAYRRAKWNRGVAERFERQKTQPTIPVEVHAIRLGDVVFASNPFEYYMDYGLQIKARSAAVQTFVVQLAGGGTYLPTLRATQGKSYGALPASTPVGPEGGRILANATVDAINELWKEPASAPTA